MDMKCPRGYAIVRNIAYCAAAIVGILLFYECFRIYELGRLTAVELVMYPCAVAGTIVFGAHTLSGLGGRR